MANIEKSTIQSYLMIYKQSKVKKVDQCFEGKSLAILKKETSSQTVTAFLRIIIAQTVGYFNVGGNMSEDQIKQTALDIMEDYYYLTIEDFKLCFSRGRRLQYGEIYRMDGSIIFGWLAKYTEERLNTAEEIYQKKHQDFKSDKPKINLTNKDFYKNVKLIDPPKEEIYDKKKAQQILAEYKKNPKAYMAKLKSGKL